MEMYCLTVTRIVIIYWRRSKPGLHSFHIQWIFISCWILGYMFQINSYTLNHTGPCYFSRDIVLFYILFMPMDIGFIHGSPS